MRAPVSCVISSFNKRDHVIANLRALAQQERPPAEVIVVDNCSGDGTAAAVRAQFPEVRLIEMPHSRFGACETFNLGFKAATQEFVAILDDDVVLPPSWIARLLERFAREPATTALITTLVIEPDMPDAYLARADVREERYLCTFRGCGSLARRAALEQAGWYDERLFIYGNERDLATRLLDLGWRVLLHPDVVTFHATPFGLKAGKRSLYYHVRNFWIYAFKHCAWSDVAKVAWRLASKALFGAKGKATTTDRDAGAAAAEATGTIGLNESLKQTPGGLWIAVKATLNACLNLPYCLARRRVCKAKDFRLPVG
ncbi:MAG: glycosyltransferase [Planctomycetes bacterium]|nr:glycosyltransferase [Planctomycetota bacterium]